MKLIKFGLMICGVFLFGMAKAEGDFFVTFKYDDGVTEDLKVEVENGETVNEPEKPIREGYSFTSWFEDDAEDAFDFDTPITENLTLTAQWTANKYKITFDYQDEKRSSSEKEVTYDEKVGELPTHERIGYTFGGWFTEKNGDGKQYTINTKYDIAQNVTLYAQWNCVTAKTEIVKKGDYILICKDSREDYPDIKYQWGYHEEREIKWEKEWVEDSLHLNCQYIKFPEMIDNNATEKYLVEITYVSGCSSICTYYEPPKPQETSQSSKITAYPNPTKQHLSVTLEKNIIGSYTVSLLNSFGKTVFSKQYAEYRENEVLSFDFNLPAGIYLLKVETNEEVFTSKIVIE